MLIVSSQLMCDVMVSNNWLFKKFSRV